MTADVPHGWGNPDSTVTQGTIRVILCARCDHASPEAGPLIVYLLVHQQITPETLHECAALVQRWTDNITIPPIDVDQLEEEIVARQRGDL
jgi:hypothetical protein